MSKDSFCEKSSTVLNLQLNSSEKDACHAQAIVCGKIDDDVKMRECE